MEFRAKFKAGLLTGVAIAATVVPPMTAQEQPSPTFEVASIKKSPPPLPNQNRVFTGIRGGPGSNDPQHATFERMRVGGLMTYAYDLQLYQFNREDPRLQQEEFDINVVVPEGATRDQFRAMLRALLTERFHLRVHWEKKSTDVFELVQAKGGHKLSAPGEAKSIGNGVDDQKLPKIPPGASGQVCVIAGCRIQQINENLDRLVVLLAANVNAPVKDATGLAGQKFDYAISWGPADATSNTAVDALPPLATAIGEQLGLRLERGKGEIDVLIVDSVDRQPIEN